MEKAPLIWQVKAHWYTIRQTCQQLGHFITGHGLTAKGQEAYNYFCKVIFDEYEPVTYAETMYEQELQDSMNRNEMDRKSAAIIMAGTLAKYITPWDFKKKPHKIVSG